MKRLVVFFTLVIAAVLGPAMAASAHPLGNFTVNQYSGLRVTATAVDVDFVVDMAEIPTFQARGDVDAAGAAYAPRQCAELVRHASLSVEGKRAALRVDRSSVAFPPGTAGLPTLRLTCSASAPTGGGEHHLAYRDDNYGDRVGWREVTAIGDGVTLTASDVPRMSRSNELTAYPNDLLQSALTGGDGRVAWQIGCRPDSKVRCGHCPVASTGLRVRSPRSFPATTSRSASPSLLCRSPSSSARSTPWRRATARR